LFRPIAGPGRPSATFILAAAVSLFPQGGNLEPTAAIARVGRILRLKRLHPAGTPQARRDHTVTAGIEGRGRIR